MLLYEKKYFFFFRIISNMRLGLYIITLLVLSIMAAAAFTIPISLLKRQNAQKKKYNTQFYMRNLALRHRLHSSS